MDALPIHDLGILNAGQVVEIKLNFPRPTGKTPASFILTLLFDSSSNPVSPQPSPFGSTLSIDPDFQYSYSTTWTVGQTNQYRVRVDQGGSSFPTAFVIYDLQVKVSVGSVILQ